MMLALLYHRTGEGKYANSLPMMERHLAYIAANYKTVLPGDDLSGGGKICLTFDDATSDFYHCVYPLLQKLQLSAVLAVPVEFIEKNSYCTWQELKALAQSPLIEIASHSVHHQNLLMPGIDLDLEIAGSKQILEKKLGVAIRTFVYPYGKFNRNIHRKVKERYEFAMRIGTACNISWQNKSGLIYRIPSDNLTAPDEIFRWPRKMAYSWFYLLNSLRSR